MLKLRSIFCVVIVINCLVSTTLTQYRGWTQSETRIKLPSDITFTHGSNGNIEGEICYNLVRRISGICTLPNQCPEAIEDYRKGIQPQICNYKGHLPIICCPRQSQTNNFVTGTPPYTTQRTTSTYAIPQTTPTTTTTTTTRSQYISSNANSYNDNDNYASQSSSYKPISYPNNAYKKKLSEQKCDEYMKLTIEETVITTLSLDPDNQTVQKSKCKKSSSEGFIVGGTKTEVGEFPHMAAIGWQQEGTDQIEWNCGGSLIR